MEIQTVGTLQEFAALEPGWQQLWLQQQDRTVFQHVAWARAFIHSFCRTTGWKILVGREHGQITALLPLWESPLPGQWRLLGSPNADYQCCLGGEAAVAGLIAHLGTHHRARSLQLESMPQGQPLWQALRLASLPLCEELPPVPCPYLTLSPETAAAAASKKGVLDNERRLAKLGPLHLRIIAHGEEQMHALETLFEQHRRLWNGSHKPSQFNSSTLCDFYRGLCRAPDLAPLLHFSVLEAGDQPLASHLGFTSGASFIYYKPTYDPAFKGAGKVLMCRLIGEALRLGLKEFDFTRGDDSYKMELATGVRHNHQARVFFSTTDRLRYQARQWLKRSVPRDAQGVSLPTKLLRQFKALLGAR